MSVTTPTPEPTPEDVSRGLAALEHLLAEEAARRASRPPVIPGETRRVRQLRAEVAEAHALADLQDDDTPLLLDTPKVRKRRKAAHEAARLHALAQDPTMRAWQAARMRRLLVTAALVSLTLALAWSTAGVQAFAADDAPAWSPAWVFAWLVEPFLSLALLVIVGARAYTATRGQPITVPALIRIEWLFLALTVGMNAWPYLPLMAEHFSFSRLVLHILGPIVAVAIVTALPIILAAFTGLDHGALTDPAYRANTGPGRTDITTLTAHAQRLIDDGALPAAPSANRIQRTLRCGMDSARAVRDALAEGETR
ncbi:hypothetical protein ACFFMN_15820 [Planobispora siamensis]|uniref:Conjugal transfer protein TraI n=1 Tax=Planobispora siamensis TaxID=936338 RepID=A0A8J3SQM7_9ACTN|nr:hypothetical protein [Planobispora siamensis]GIH93913.1 hypothetical protein Psi01_45430 [Planobispora siamensis]